MAFTSKHLPVSRDKYFTFFATDGDAAIAPDIEFVETFGQSCAVELEKVRIHLSTVHISVVDFTANLSHHINSVYDQTLLSKAMLGVKDYEYRFDPTLKLHPSDVIRFSLIISAVNTYGLEVSGWTITKPTAGY